MADEKIPLCWATALMSLFWHRATTVSLTVRDCSDESHWLISFHKGTCALSLCWKFGPLGLLCTCWPWMQQTAHLMNNQRGVPMVCTWAYLGFLHSMKPAWNTCRKTDPAGRILEILDKDFKHLNFPGHNRWAEKNDMSRKSKQPYIIN